MFPQNDYRDYLIHWGKGKEAKNHKYISKHKSKNGNWVYEYDDGKSIVKLSPLEPDGYINSNGKKVYYADEEEFMRNNNLSPKPDGYIDSNGKKVYYADRAKNLDKTLKKAKKQRKNLEKKTKRADRKKKRAERRKKIINRIKSFFGK